MDKLSICRDCFHLVLIPKTLRDGRIIDVRCTKKNFPFPKNWVLGGKYVFAWERNATLCADYEGEDEDDPNMRGEQK